MVVLCCVLGEFPAPGEVKFHGNAADKFNGQPPPPCCCPPPLPPTQENVAVAVLVPPLLLLF